MAKNEAEKAPPAPPVVQPDAPPLASQLVELRAELEAKDSQLTSAQRDIEELKGLLKQASTEMAVLTGKLDAGAISALPNLGSDSYELLASVTIFDRAGVRITPRKGDVVTIEDPARVQAKVEGRARVYAVDKGAVDELAKMGALRA